MRSGTARAEDPDDADDGLDRSTGTVLDASSRSTGRGRVHTRHEGLVGPRRARASAGSSVPRVREAGPHPVAYVVPASDSLVPASGFAIPASVVPASAGARIAVIDGPPKQADDRLPRRAGSVADWERFLAVARVSRSAVELLGAVLRRPVRAEAVGNRVVELGAASQDARRFVRVVEHRLLDSRPPHRALARCATALVGARLPGCVRAAARRGDPLSELLDSANAFWTPETLGVEQLPADAAGWTGRQPVVRLTRRLFLLGTPVADVVEDIPFPDPAAVRGPPVS